jgi:DNA-binding response OmpR family regulator
MTLLRYELASAAVYDPIAMNRNATRNVLYALGFREIESYAALEDLRRAMVTRDFDLIMAEAPAGSEPVYDFISRVRRSEHGSNPFAMMLVTTWQAEGEMVRQALDCGADDIICRPFSTATLGERMRTHVLNRKGFVVTSDYIGPDRRKTPGRAGLQPIQVVNSLRLKAAEGLSGQAAQAATQAAVEEGRHAVNEERMRRAAFQIGVIAGFVVEQIESGVEGAVRFTDLQDIHRIAGDLSVIATAENATPVFKTAITVADVARMSMDGNDLSRNAKILVQLSVALQVTLSPGLNENACRAELTETLERIRSRGRAG